MSNSFQLHGHREIHKQLRFRMKSVGLNTIEIQVFRRAGKTKISFTGSPEEVVKAEQILAAWA
jgi:hypothetical protein